MTKPTRPKVLPTGSSIPPPSMPPGSLPPSPISQGRIVAACNNITTWRWHYEDSQQRLAQAQEENHVRGECLALAVTALGKTGGLGYSAFAQSILAEIEARLAQLEPEEKTE